MSADVRHLEIVLAIKFRWLITWGRYEKKMRIPLPFQTNYTGVLAVLNERGVSLTVSIEAGAV